MRKYVFLICFSLFFISAFAQNLDFGLRFSPHFSWYKIDVKDSIKNDNPGFMFSYGLVGDFNFAENYALNIEITQVFFNANTIDNHKNVIKWKLQNIEIPIALKMKTTEINNIKYFGKFGITPSINTNAKKNDVKANKNIKLINLGMIIGGGIYYKLADKTYALAGLTLHNFFLPVNQNTEIYSLKPVYLSIDLGFMF